MTWRKLLKKTFHVWKRFKTEEWWENYWINKNKKKLLQDEKLNSASTQKYPPETVLLLTVLLLETLRISLRTYAI